MEQEQEQTIKVTKTEGTFHFTKATGVGEEICVVILTINYTTKLFSIRPFLSRKESNTFGFIDGYGIRSAARWKTIAELISEAANFARKETENDYEELPF